MKKKLSRFGGQNSEKFNFENLVFYRKDGKKGIFLVFLGNIFHKKAREPAHVHVGHVVWKYGI